MSLGRNLIPLVLGMTQYLEEKLAGAADLRRGRPSCSPVDWNTPWLH